MAAKRSIRSRLWRMFWGGMVLLSAALWLSSYLHLNIWFSVELRDSLRIRSIGLHQGCVRWFIHRPVKPIQRFADLSSNSRNTMTLNALPGTANVYRTAPQDPPSWITIRNTTPSRAIAALKRTLWLPRWVVLPPPFGTGKVEEVRVPLWLPLLLSMIMLIPALWNDHLRSRRSKLGQCVKCGYSLVGLTAQRCPECGDGFITNPTAA